MRDVMADCLERGIRVVVNAGGLNPTGLASALQTLATELGVDPVVAAVDGDDLMSRLDQVPLMSFEDGSSLSDADVTPVTVNAYLGCWGIVEALERGADIVVTGRVTDAALVMGPAAHSFGWGRDEWDRLAGALVAGHVIECGAQATGGNYAFFQQVPGLDHVGFPLVEMAEDGSFVVTKHPGTGGMVTTGTVTAQLLYEVGGHRYPNPDVTARFDTIRLEHTGPDRVRVSGVVGQPPPPRLKVAINYLGGYRNQVTFVLTGLDIEAKAAAVEAALWKAMGGRESVDEAEVGLVRWDRPNPTSNEQAMAHLRVTVKDQDADKVGRRFSGAAVELALANYPGFFATEPPGDASPYAVYWPATVDRDLVPARVHVSGELTEVSSVAPATSDELADVIVSYPAFSPVGETVAASLGRVAGARSGDKGGDANVGIWVEDPAAFAWLSDFLSEEGFRRLLPEADSLAIERHVFPNLSALNFVVKGLLGQGVAASTRLDPQAKSLGEYVRARLVDLPLQYLGRRHGAEKHEDAGSILGGK